VLEVAFAAALGAASPGVRSRSGGELVLELQAIVTRDISKEVSDFMPAILLSGMCGVKARNVVLWRNVRK
jgi:hypothetical protein